jgi:hypothetical protein
MERDDEGVRNNTELADRFYMDLAAWDGKAHLKELSDFSKELLAGESSTVPNSLLK